MEAGILSLRKSVGQLLLMAKKRKKVCTCRKSQTYVNEKLKEIKVIQINCLHYL